MKWPVLMALLLAAAPGGEPPKVHISAPRGGWTAQRVVPVSGSVSDKRLRSLQLSVNGVARTVNARQGRFEARLPARPGLNSVEALAHGPAGSGRDRVTFYSSAPAPDVLIQLTWDTDGTDLDLHVTEPSGEECYHGNRQSASGGSLEVDDTDGFGPEIYLVPRAPLGEYRIAVAYYDAGRAPQTDALVEVVIRQGTPHERRLTFPVTLTHEDEMLEVGTFYVDRPVE